MKKPSFFICLILTIVIVFITVFALNDKTNNKDNLEFNTIEIWQVDTFEGGIGSRASFLKSVAKEYEKKNKMVLFSVRQMTLEGTIKALKDGSVPDIISYGVGLSEIKPYLKEITAKIESPFTESEEGKVLAVGWAYGLYVKIDKKGQKGEKLIVSQNTFTQPLFSYYYNNLEYDEIEVLPPKDAYSKFNLSKNCSLLGTQRDLFRLSQKSVEIDFEPLGGFSDLIQYVSILSKETKKLKILNEFVELLFGEIQEKIPSSIGLIPVSNLSKIVDNEVIGTLIGVKIDKTISVFTKNEALFSLQRDAFYNIKNNEFLKVIAKSNVKLLK